MGNNTNMENMENVIKTEKETQEWYNELLGDFMRAANPKNRIIKGRVGFLNAAGEMYDRIVKSGDANGLYCLLFLSKLNAEKLQTAALLLAHLFEGRETFMVDDEAYLAIKKYAKEKNW